MLTLQISYRGMVALGLAYLTIVALSRLWPLLVLLCSALILMGALLPLVRGLQQRGAPRPLAVTIVCAAVFIGALTLAALTLPALIIQLRSIALDLPVLASQVDTYLEPHGIRPMFEQRVGTVDWRRVLEGSAGYGRAVLSAFLSIVTVAVLTVYLVAEAPRISRFIARLLPSHHHADSDFLLSEMERIVGGYIRGQAITSAFISAYTAGVLFALDIPNALAFGILAGFFDIIPIVGALGATIPPAVAALQVSTGDAAVVLGALLAYQQFEDRILLPRVYGSTLNLPPVAVLLATLAGAQLLGVVGVLLALPAVASLRLCFEYWLARRAASPGRAAAATTAIVRAAGDENPDSPVLP